METEIVKPDISPDIEQKLKHRTTKISVVEGSIANVSLTFGDNFLTPFTMALGGSNAEVGILNSFIGIINPAMQIVGARWMESAPRKKLLVGWVFFQAFMFPLFFFLAYSYYKNIDTSILPILAIIVILVYYGAGNIPSPVWFSLMGDVVPEDRRGRYFAMRNVVTNISATTMLIIMSLELDREKAVGTVILGFSLIFVIGFFCRLGSGTALTQHYYPKYIMQHDKSINFWKFIKELPKNNFGRFCLLAALITFAQYLCNPFFTVYMLDDLNFPYEMLILVNVSQTLISFVVYPFCGRFSDKYGNIKMLKIGASLIPFISLFWLFITTPVGLIFGPQLISSVGWTAFNLAASNFIYDCFPSEKRGLYSAFYNFLLGIGIVLGGLTGTAIITFLNITFMNPIQFLFLISAIARGIIVIILLPMIKEIRNLCPK